MASKDIVVNVVAKSEGFSKGINKAKTESKGFASGIKANMVPALLGAAAAFAAVSKAVGLLSGELNRLTNIGNFAVRLDVPVEQLQELSIAAERAGMSAQSMLISTQRAMRRIADAAKKGSGPLMDWLEEMGIKSEEIAEANAADALMMLGKGIMALEGQGKRAAAAMAFLDTEGVALLQMFPTLEAELQKIAKEDLIVSQEDIDKALSFDKAMVSLKQHVSSLLVEIGLLINELMGVEGDDPLAGLILAIQTIKTGVKAIRDLVHNNPILRWMFSGGLTPAAAALAGGKNPLDALARDINTQVNGRGDSRTETADGKANKEGNDKLLAEAKEGNRLAEDQNALLEGLARQRPAADVGKAGRDSITNIQVDFR